MVVGSIFWPFGFWVCKECQNWVFSCPSSSMPTLVTIFIAIQPSSCEHVRSTGPIKVLDSEVNFWNDCSLNWRLVSHGPQVHGVLPGADKPGSKVLLQPHNWHWFLLLLGHQRVWKTCFCCGWTSQEEEEEEVESIWFEKESKKAPRFPEKEVWRREGGRLCVANSWKGTCSSTSDCWSSAYTCASAEEGRGRHAITSSYITSGLWTGQVWQHVEYSMWTDFQQWRWVKSSRSSWSFTVQSREIFNTLSMGWMHISWIKTIVSCRREL